jgi:hypothetical protein
LPKESPEEEAVVSAEIVTEEAVVVLGKLV